MYEWAKETKWSCPRLLLFFFFSLSLCCCCCSAFIIIKSDIGCIYYSARYAETRQPWSLVRVLLCSWLTFKPGCYGFQHRFNMYVLATWYLTLTEVGNGFIIHVTRQGKIERDRCKSKVVFWQGYSWIKWWTACVTCCRFIIKMRGSVVGIPDDLHRGLVVV